MGWTNKVILFYLTFGTSVYAEVLDVDGGEYSTVAGNQSSVVRGVLDFDRPPKRSITPLDTTAAALNSNSPRRGTAEVETMVSEVALHYARHPGIRASGLSTTEWFALFRANIAIESNFRQSARSHVGAIGLGQLMPSTARTLGVDPYDARQNLHGSARYLLAQLQDFRSKELALAAYNAGPEAVIQYGGIPPYRETQGHVRKVLEFYHATL